MKISGKTGFLAVALALALSLTAQAQTALYPLFGPSSGIMKGDPATPVTSSAAAADVYGLFGCTLSTQFLNGAGGCTTPSGTGVTSVGLTVPSWETVSGSPVTGSGTLAVTAATGQTANRFLATPDGTTGAVSLRAMVAGDVPPINLGSTANGGVSSATILLGTNGGTSNGFFSVTGPTTTLRTFTFPNASATVLTSNAAVTVAQGGTGLATLTNHGVLLGQGASNVSAVAAMAADTLLQGQGTGADPAGVAVNNCGSASTALSYSTSTHTFGCQTISVGGSGTVTSVTAGAGLAASPNPIVSTGTMTLDLTAANTWTGNQTFRGASVCENNSGAGSFTQCVLNTSSGSTVSNYLSFNSLGTLKGVLLNERVAGGNCSGDALDDMCLRSISGNVYVNGGTRTGYAAVLQTTSFTTNGSTCTLVNNVGIASCARTGAGVYTMTAASSPSNCVANTTPSAGSASIPLGYITISGTTLTLSTFTGTGSTNTAADLTSGALHIICM